MSERQIEISFPKEGIRAQAALLDKKAPVTCDRLWQQLEKSLSFNAAHAIWTGPEISLQIPPAEVSADLAGIPPENQTVFPVAGALLYAYMPRHAFAGIPSPIYDIGIFYAPGGRVFLPMGWVPCNHFAQLEGDWEAFADCCCRTRIEGQKELLIARATQ